MRELLARLRAANPVPSPVEPDWERVREHVLGAPDGAAEARPLVAERPRPRARAVASGFLICAALVAGVLLALAPWSGSAGYLARAAAALTPIPGSVLYERWQHVVAAEPGNRIYTHTMKIGPEQLWLEGSSPRRYRAILEPDRGVPVGQDLAFAYGVDVGLVSRSLGRPGSPGEFTIALARRLAGGPLEIAGALESSSGRTQPGAVPPTLTYLPGGELLHAKLQVALGATLPGPHDGAIEDGADPVGVLRSAIAEGRAQEAGSARYEGRTVERIRFDLPRHLPADAPPLPADAPKFHSQAYAYVEPGTLHPLEIVFGRDTYRFLAYEYLPASAANRALTSIRAQHPHARITRRP